MSPANELKYSIRRWVSGRPAIYLPIRRMRVNWDGNVDRRTEIVIEGFPRSGNSFAEAAFRMTQSRPMRIGHHSHAVAQVIQACRWKIPALVLIRDPVDAACSLVMLDPTKNELYTAISDYVYYYRHLMPYRNGVVLASFAAVTTDFGNVTAVVNRRFGTDFARFPHTAENVLAAYDLVDKLSRERGAIAPDSVEPYSPRADDEIKTQRKLQKEQLLREIESDRCAAVLSEAKSLYKQMLANVDV